MSKQRKLTVQRILRALDAIQAVESRENLDAALGTLRSTLAETKHVYDYDGVGFCKAVDILRESADFWREKLSANKASVERVKAELALHEKRFTYARFR